MDRAAVTERHADTVQGLDLNLDRALFTVCQSFDIYMPLRGVTSFQCFLNEDVLFIFCYSSGKVKKF